MGQLILPKAIATGPGGTVFVVDSFRDDISKFTSTGTYVTKFGSFPDVFEPRGLAVDASGNVYTSDYINFEVIKYNSSYSKVNSIGGAFSVLLSGINFGFKWPGQMAVDSAGNMYIADTGNRRIHKISNTFMPAFQ